MRIDSSGVSSSRSPLMGEAKRTPSSVILRKFAEAEYLEAARVGEYRAVPAHEAVQPAVRRDHLQPRPQPQMKRVAEHDAGAEFGELGRAHRLHRAVGADRHEDRRLDLAVGKREHAAPRSLVPMRDFELHWRILECITI